MTESEEHCVSPDINVSDAASHHEGIKWPEMDGEGDGFPVVSSVCVRVCLCAY